MSIKSLIRTIPHYPKPGVMFRDITTLLKDPPGFKLTIERDARRWDRAWRTDPRRRCCFVIELPELGGRKCLEALGHPVLALCAFEGH